MGESRVLPYLHEVNQHTPPPSREPSAPVAAEHKIAASDQDQGSDTLADQLSAVLCHHLGL